MEASELIDAPAGDADIFGGRLVQWKSASLADVEKALNTQKEQLEGLRKYLDSIEINSNTIGDIRRRLMMPWDADWNGIVRDETPSREKPAPEATPETQVAQTKRWRQQLDAILQEMKSARAEDISITKSGADFLRRCDLLDARAASACRLIEAVMWLGMVLKAIGTPNPYPQSYDPSSPVVEKTADNLKL